jgi:PAS domain-containing protein
VNCQENASDADRQRPPSIGIKGPFSSPDFPEMQKFEQSVSLAMARAAALCQAFQTRTLSPKASLVTIVEELQVIVEELQATYKDVWVQQATLWDRQERILQENERYSSFFQFITEGALFTNGEGLITVANEALGQLLNLPEPALVGLSLLDFVPLELRLEFKARLRSLPQQRVIQNWDTVLQLPSGAFLSVRLSVKWCLTVSGEELCWLVRGRPQYYPPSSPLPPSQSLKNQELEQSTAALTAINQQLRTEVEARRRAEQALQRQARQDQLLHAIANRVRSSLELDQVLTATVTEVRHLLDVDRVMILQFKDNGTKLVATESRNEVYPSLLAKAYQEPCFQPRSIDHYRQGGVRALEDILTDNAQLHPCLVETLKAHDVRALLLVPILQQNQIWGMVVAHHCRAPRPWR